MQELGATGPTRPFNPDHPVRDRKRPHTVQVRLCLRHDFLAYSNEVCRNSCESSQPQISRQWFAFKAAAFKQWQNQSPVDEQFIESCFGDRRQWPLEGAKRHLTVLRQHRLAIAIDFDCQGMLGVEPVLRSRAEFVEHALTAGQANRSLAIIQRDIRGATGDAPTERQVQCRRSPFGEAEDGSEVDETP